MIELYCWYNIGYTAERLACERNRDGRKVTFCDILDIAFITKTSTKASVTVLSKRKWNNTVRNANLEWCAPRWPWWVQSRSTGWWQSIKWSRMQTDAGVLCRMHTSSNQQMKNIFCLKGSIWPLDDACLSLENRALGDVRPSSWWALGFEVAEDTKLNHRSELKSLVNSFRIRTELSIDPRSRYTQALDGEAFTSNERLLVTRQDSV